MSLTMAEGLQLHEYLGPFQPTAFCDSGIIKGQVNSAAHTINGRKHHTQEPLPLQQALVAWSRKQLLVLRLSLVLRSMKAPYSEKTIYC